MDTDEPRYAATLGDSGQCRMHAPDGRLARVAEIGGASILGALLLALAVWLWVGIKVRV